MPRKKMTITPTDAEEAPMTPITDAEHDQNMLESSLGTAEMTDAEAIETLVRTDETHLTEDDDGVSGQDRESYTDDQDRESYTVTETPKQVKVGTTPGTTKQKTQGSLPEKFHCLSEIDDGVFVAWDRCHSSTTTRHSISECKCKGGPTEPPYVTKWREEWIEKRTKAQVKAVAALKKDARQNAGLEPLAATVSDGIDAAKEAVQAAATEEVANDSA
jgi:hypothetical protein